MPLDSVCADPSFVIDGKIHIRGKINRVPIGVPSPKLLRKSKHFQIQIADFAGSGVAGGSNESRIGVEKRRDQTRTISVEDDTGGIRGPGTQESKDPLLRPAKPIA